MWNYSVENTTLWFLRLLYIHEIWLSWVEPHLFKKKRHIHQEPANLTWFRKRVPAAALKWSGGHEASARAHTERSVTPQGKSGQTRREKATCRGRQRLGFGCSHIQATARTVGSPQKWGQTPGTLLPQSLLGGHAADTWVFTAVSTTATKCMSVVFSYTACGTLLQRSLETNTVVVLTISKLTVQTFTAYKVWFRKFPLSFPPNWNKR